MKRLMNIAAVAGALAAVAVLLSCETLDYTNKYDARQKARGFIPEKVTSGMPEDRTQVPDGARDVEWEQEGSFWKLSYEVGAGVNKVEYEVWFDSDGNWVKSQNEIRFADVPKYIKEYLDADPVCSKATFERDADYIERPSGVSYRFDGRVNGSDIDVEVTGDGTVTVFRD